MSFHYLASTEREVPCPICAAKKPCMKLCNGKGTVDLEDLARTLAEEQRAEAFAEAGQLERMPAVSEKWWAEYRAHYYGVARSYLSELQTIYSPPATGPGGE